VGLLHLTVAPALRKRELEPLVGHASDVVRLHRLLYFLEKILMFVSVIGFHHLTEQQSGMAGRPMSAYFSWQAISEAKLCMSGWCWMRNTRPLMGRQ